MRSELGCADWCARHIDNCRRRVTSGGSASYPALPRGRSTIEHTTADAQQLVTLFKVLRARGRKTRPTERFLKSGIVEDEGLGSEIEELERGAVNDLPEAGGALAWSSPDNPNLG